MRSATSAGATTSAPFSRSNARAAVTARTYTRLEAALGCALPPELTEQALTHRSYAYEHGGLPTNERLEFLGDAVLGLVVTDALYREYPDLAEGQLAKLRASVVNTKALATVARSIGLGEWLRLGRGELGTGGADKNSILADTTEALIGAVWMTHGYRASASSVGRLLEPLMSQVAAEGVVADWKTSLQELSATRGCGVPDYAISGSGPDHARHYTAHVLVSDQIRGSGEGVSKKEAEQHAAEMAFRALSQDHRLPGREPGQPDA